MWEHRVERQTSVLKARPKFYAKCFFSPCYEYLILSYTATHLSHPFHNPTKTKNLIPKRRQTNARVSVEIPSPVAEEAKEIIYKTHPMHTYTLS